MKKFWKGMMEWKTNVCLMYTGAMCIYLYFCWMFGAQEIPATLLWSLLLGCALGGLVQMVCFSTWIIRRLRPSLRSLLFVVLFLPILTLLAWKAQWFPTDNPGAWIAFLGMFFAIFVVTSIGYSIYFRVTGRKYDGLLGMYRKQKEE